VKVAEGRKTVLVRNSGATNEVYLGPSDVTSATGFSLAAATSVGRPLELREDDALYAICASGESTTVSVLEFGARSS
jgi:hypothetical protein